MADELSAELDLNIKDALSGVDDLRDELEKAIKDTADEFSDQYDKAISGVPDLVIEPDVDKIEPAITDAIEGVDTALVIEPDVADVAPAIDDVIASVDALVPIEADVTAVEPTISGAIAEVDTEVVIDADVTAVEPTISGAITAVDTEVVIEADTDAVGPAIDAATAGADAIISIDADTAEAEGAIAQLSADIFATISIEGDTEPAQQAIDGLIAELGRTPIELGLDIDTEAAQESLGAVAGVSEDAGDSIDTATAATGALNAASGLTSGTVDALTNTVGGLATKAGGMGVAIGAGVVTIGAFTTQAVNALGAAQRLSDTFGDLAGKMATINVGSLNLSLKELALQTGSSGSGMKNAAVDAFQMTTSFGKGREESERYAEQLLALAGRAVALNPNLGETGDVATRLATALRSGRDKALVPYGIGLTNLEISQRAASLAMQDGRAVANSADKAMAGASLAVEKFGGVLQRDIAQGAENPILQVRRLAKEFASMTTEVGKPLVAPAIELLDKAKPIVEQFGEVLLSVAQAALPVLTLAFEVLGEVIPPIVDLLQAIPAPLIAAGGALLLFGNPIKTLVGQFSETGKAAQILGSGFGKVGQEGLSSGQKLGLAAAGAGVAATSFMDLAKGTDNAAPGILGMAAGGALIGAAFGPAGAAIGGFSGLVAGSVTHLIAGGESVDDYRKKFTELGKEIEGASTKESLAEFIDKLGFEDALSLMAGSAKGLTDELQALAAASPGAAAKVLAGLKAMKDEAGKPLFTGKEFDKLEEAVTKGNNAYKKHQEEAQKTAIATQQVVLASLSEVTALDIQKASMDAATTAAQAHKAAQIEIMSATQEATLATQQQAAEDAVAIANAEAKALSARTFADGQRAVATETFAQMGAFSSAQDAAIRYGAGIGTAKEYTDALATASGTLNSALDLLLGKFLTGDQAANNYKLAELALGDQLLANGFAFDENSKAGLENQNILDGLGQKAMTAASGILESTGSLSQALVPLQSFRDTLGKLRDDMATAGQDTTFLDGVIWNVDQSIIKLTAAAGPAAAAASGTMTAATAAWLASLAPMPPGTQAAVDAATGAVAGAGTPGAASTTAGATAANWAAGLDPIPGDTEAAMATAAANVSSGGGNAAGAAGSTAGAAETNWAAGLDPIPGDADAAMAGATSAVANASGPMGGAARGTGDQGTAGLTEGMAPMPGVAEGSVLDSVNAAALAGANAHNVGYGIGAAFSEGIGDGIYANLAYVRGAADAIVAEAKRAAGAKAEVGSPSKLFAREIGLPIAEGVAMGINQGSPSVSDSARDIVSHAERASSRNNVAVANRSTVQFNIRVDGVNSPAVGRAVGEQIGKGAADALARRRVVVNARTG